MKATRSFKKNATGIYYHLWVMYRLVLFSMGLTVAWFT